MADTHTEESELEQRIGALVRAISIPVDQESQLRVLIKLGNELGRSEESARSIGIFRRALELARSLEKPHFAGVCAGNLGAALAETGEIREALLYFEEALTIATKLGDDDGERITTQNIATLRRTLIASASDGRP